MRIITNFAAAGLAAPLANAILVAPSSPCSTDCGNVLSSTTSDDIVCSQNSYSSGSGASLRDWALYNLRYATSYCLFGTPDNDNVVTTPCITSKACGPFQDAIEFKNLSSNVDSYDYCTLWPVTDTADFNGCTACLQAGDQEYLANFVIALQAGCEQQPVAGITIGLDGTVFSAVKVNITEPSAVATANPDWFDDGPITLGAKVGIAIGGLVFILVVLGCGIVWNGKRRRRAFLRQLESKHGHEGWPSPHQREMHETHESHETHATPLSQRPLRGWDDSPMSATTTEKTYPRYFSPYSSQYNSPVSAQDGGPSMQWPGPTHPSHSPSGFALSAELSNRWDPSLADAYRRQGSAETYEMHDVDSSAGASFRDRMQIHQAMGMGQEPPMLGHPGYGRSENSPPRRYPVAEDDTKVGSAA
ncbi:hypothetical protein G7Z17_g6103 [Cylindrodendrum hubeiense]|uniref:Uncharacterized protein n=1 Tax=Cylindrodendrum hubeiense TaxID=595255 RepID=A0A9P5H9N3_9HYPO|nr:hypothetical protein G7Z17_g6103 [Cylindrodendrum hubeiense]